MGTVALDNYTLKAMLITIDAMTGDNTTMMKRNNDRALVDVAHG